MPGQMKVEDEEHSSLPTFPMSCDNPDRSTMPSHVQSKRSVHRVGADGRVTDYEYRNKGIPGAPPLATDLPWEHLSEITSPELIIFFPNHTLRVGAIAARLFVEGFPQSEVSRLIHLSRQMGYDPPQEEQLAISNSVRVQLRAAERKFAEGTLHRRVHERTVSHQELISTPWKWVPSKGAVAGRWTPEPAWSLHEIVLRFPGDILALPVFGPFTLKLKQIWQDYLASATVDAAGVPWVPSCHPLPDLPNNPPHLPPYWTNNMHTGLKALPTIDPEGTWLESQAKSGQLRMTKNGNQVNAKETLDQYKWDAERIMSEAPHMIAGELILFFCSKSGFRMTLRDIGEGVNRSHPDGRSKLHMTSLSHRLVAALKERAKRNARPYELEMSLYGRDERFIKNGNQTKLVKKSLDMPMQDADNTGTGLSEYAPATNDTTGRKANINWKPASGPAHQISSYPLPSYQASAPMPYNAYVDDNVAPAIGPSPASYEPPFQDVSMTDDFQQQPTTDAQPPYYQTSDPFLHDTLLEDQYLQRILGNWEWPTSASGQASGSASSTAAARDFENIDPMLMAPSLDTNLNAGAGGRKESAGVSPYSTADAPLKIGCMAGIMNASSAFLKRSAGEDEDGRAGKRQRRY